jgi:hypothetical protein
MTDEEFDNIIEQVESFAQSFVNKKPVIVKLLSHATKRRGESNQPAKGEWRRETNRLDLLREASNLIEKALAK